MTNKITKNRKRIFKKTRKYGGSSRNSELNRLRNELTELQNNHWSKTQRYELNRMKENEEFKKSTRNSANAAHMASLLPLEPRRPLLSNYDPNAARFAASLPLAPTMIPRYSRGYAHIRRPLEESNTLPPNDLDFQQFIIEFVEPSGFLSNSIKIDPMVLEVIRELYYNKVSLVDIIEACENLELQFIDIASNPNLNEKQIYRELTRVINDFVIKKSHNVTRGFPLKKSVIAENQLGTVIFKAYRSRYRFY